MIRKMPTSVYDASYITFRRRAGVLSAYNTALKNFASAEPGNYNLVRREQPTLQTNEIIITRQQGACICAQDASGIPFNRNSSGPCSCAR